MKRTLRLSRLPDLFIPAALLGASALGQPKGAALFFACLTAHALLSLFAGQALRVCFAAQPSLRGVRGSVKLTLLLQAAALPVALMIARFTRLNEISALWAYLCAGCLYNIEHTFYEYLDALGDRHGAALCEGISALLLMTGLCLTGSPGGTVSDLQPLWLIGFSALSALIAATAGLVSGAFSKGKVNAKVLSASPRAALQTLLYPAAFVPTLFLPLGCGASVAFFSGLALYAFCRTPFRRSPSESSPMNRGLALICAACALLSALSHLTGLLKPAQEANIYAGFNLTYACLALALAALCAFALYGNIRRKER